MSHFRFIDQVEGIQGDSLTAFFTLTGDEEFLKDHFEGFPVMPGVLLLESLKQASAAWLSQQPGYEKSFFRLVSAEDVKFGYFVKPGTQLKIFTRFTGQSKNNSQFEGRIHLAGSNAQTKVLSANIILAAVS